MSSFVFLSTIISNLRKFYSHVLTLFCPTFISFPISLIYYVGIYVRRFLSSLCVCCVVCGCLCEAHILFIYCNRDGYESDALSTLLRPSRHKIHAATKANSINHVVWMRVLVRVRCARLTPNHTTASHLREQKKKRDNSIEYKVRRSHFNSIVAQ